MSRALKANSGERGGEIVCLAGNPKGEVGEVVKVHRIRSNDVFHPDGVVCEGRAGARDEVAAGRDVEACRPEVLLTGWRHSVSFPLLRHRTADRDRTEEADSMAIVVGLSVVLELRFGLEQLREGKAPRAKKLVVRVRDTPAGTS